VSLAHGVVTLAERHGGIVVTPQSYEAMVVEVGEMIAPFAREHGGDGLCGVHMLGTSGTVTTIAGVHLDLKRYDRNRVDGCWMSEQEITAVIERLLAMSYQERVASPCIGAERADLVLAGCAILDAIRRAFPCERLRVADRGERQAIGVERTGHFLREYGVVRVGAVADELCERIRLLNRLRAGRQAHHVRPEGSVHRGRHLVRSVKHELLRVGDRSAGVLAEGVGIIGRVLVG